MRKYKDFKAKLLRDKTIKKAYDELGPEFALVANALDAELRVSIS